MCIRPLVQYGPCNSFSLGLLNGWCVGLVYNFYSNIIFFIFHLLFCALIQKPSLHLPFSRPPQIYWLYIQHKHAMILLHLTLTQGCFQKLLLASLQTAFLSLPTPSACFIFLPNTNPIGAVIYIFAWFLVCSLLPTRIKVPWHLDWMCSDHFSISNVWNPAASRKMLYKCLLKTCLSWHLILTEQFAYKILLQTCLYPK